MTTWIAEASVVFVHSNGTRCAGRIALGAPVERDSDCACQIALDGMSESFKSFAIYGEGTLQALLLASRFLGMSLHNFLSRGGRVIYPPDENEGAVVDVPLAALFGPLLCGPDPQLLHHDDDDDDDDEE